MKNRLKLVLLTILAAASVAAALENRFLNPPDDSRLGVYWFWANTVTKEGIQSDLKAMKEAGIGRALLAMTRAHSATVESGGVVFLSPEWLSLFLFALDEAERQGIRIAALMSNGWYQGAPWVTPEMGAQMLVWSETAVNGPKAFSGALPRPDKFREEPHAMRLRPPPSIPPRAREGDFKPVAVLAFRMDGDGKLLGDSMVRLDEQVEADGTLDWDVPAGNWRIFRFAHVPNFVRMKQDSPGFTGLQIDHLSAETMRLFFEKVGLPMLEAAGPHVGKTLEFFHEDSMELGHFDWTGKFPEQFQALRGYDLIPKLPALAGWGFTGEPEASRIEEDFLLTVDELLAEEHYGTFRELCHRHGIKLQTEGGDVHGSLRVKAATDAVMGEFWNSRPTRLDVHFLENSNMLRAFNPNTVMAARVYGHNRVSVEAFTTPNMWVEYPAMLKPMADEVFCLGVNHLYLHGFSYSRPETPPPGDIYFAGTHFTPGLTWWKYANPFFDYLNRCQALLLAGHHVADLLYVDGKEVQGMIHNNEARTLTAPGKFDAIPADLFVETVSVLPDGRIGLPHGLSYEVLVVANTSIEPEVMKKITQLVEQGATVWFRKVPERAFGMMEHPEADAIVTTFLEKLGANRPAGVYSAGQGRVILGDSTVSEMLESISALPDFDYVPEAGEPFLDYSHRRIGDTEVYFMANWKDRHQRARAFFRVQGKLPEFWDPVTGRIESAPEYSVEPGRVGLPLELPPYGSMFVIFRQPAEVGTSAVRPASPSDRHPQTIEIGGPWRIEFNHARPEIEAFEVESAELFPWHESKDSRIKSFAGTAVYHAAFFVDGDWLKDGRAVHLDLGEVHNLAEVLVNGKSLGVVWTAPFQVDATPALKADENRLEIRVINTWNNWRIQTNFAPADQPWAQRRGGSLQPGGLPGPVRMLVE